MQQSAYVVNTEALIPRMRETPPFHFLDEQDCRDLLSHSRIREFAAGDTIITEGEDGAAIYYLLFGKVRVVKKGAELIVLQRTGDIFGEMKSLGGARRSASVIAIEEAVCLEVDLSAWDRLAPEGTTTREIVFRGFAGTLANRLKHTTDELIRAQGEIKRLKFKLSRIRHMVDSR
jgi:CRP-like cAMP-binding protein